VSNEAPKLEQVNVVARDVAASVEFYRRLGVEIEESQPPWADRHRNGRSPGGADVDIDSDEFAAEWGSVAGPGVLLNFRVPTREAVDGLHDDLVAAGYHSRKAPYDAMWGSRFAVVDDPDGTPVGLMSPRGG
jgi:catechol 2,3-dioxygenase-like lactoylglutathione lyase family enzyme